MNIVKSLALAAVLAASAATAHASVIYATTVDNFTQGGNTVPGGIIDPARSNPANALGAPDGKFVSIGLGGTLTVGFGRLFKSPGAVWEITFNNRDNHFERVNVYAGLANAFTYVGSVTNAVLMNTFTFTGLFDQIKLVDTSPAAKNRDGYDVDSISVTPVPVPAAGLLLLSAIGAFGMLRRRMA